MAVGFPGGIKQYDKSAQQLAQHLWPHWETQFPVPNALFIYRLGRNGRRRLVAARSAKTVYWFPLVITLLLTGCTTYHAGQFARISDVPCLEKPTNVHLFFGGEAIDFGYEKVGFVEAGGEEPASNEAVLNQLRYQAWQHCADAIIQVEKDYKYGQESNSDRSSREVYGSAVFTGIAVKVQRDSAFIAKYERRMDTHFIEAVREDRLQSQKRDVSNKTVSVFGIFIAIILAVAFSAR